MQITSTIENCFREAAKSRLYYAARYIKQANNANKYEKNIFDDEARNLPSDEVRDLTLKIISAIEEREGKRGAYFNDETVIRLLDEITGLGAALFPGLSEDERERAEAVAAGMQPPD